MQLSSFFILALAGMATAYNCACGNGSQGKSCCSKVGGTFDGSVCTIPNASKPKNKFLDCCTDPVKFC